MSVVRALVEMRLLKAGIPWDALEGATEQRVVEWVAVLNEIDNAQEEAQRRGM